MRPDRGGPPKRMPAPRVHAKSAGRRPWRRRGWVGTCRYPLPLTPAIGVVSFRVASGTCRSLRGVNRQQGCHRPANILKINLTLGRRMRSLLGAVRCRQGHPMKFPRRQFLRLAAGATVLLAVPPTARAQAYPTRPVRLIVPSAPGGTPDITARLIGQWLSERLSQPFVVENRAGAGGNIGAEAGIRAAPDGYTLLLVTSANGINAALYEKLNFNLIRDIAPVAGIVRGASSHGNQPIISG
jgi:hypothetical protein